MRSIDEAKRNLRSGFPYCGYQESLPQYRVVRWFLLPEAELAAAGDKVKYKPAETEVMAT